MHQNYHPVLTYSAFYQKNELPERNLNNLDGLDRDMVIKLFCRLKMTLSKNDTSIFYPFTEWLISKLPDGHRERADKLLRTGPARHFLTTPLIVNQIFVDLLNGPPATLIPGNERVDYISLAIIETLLIYNEHHFRSVMLDGRQDDHDLLWEIMLLQDINGKNQASFARSGAIKQAIFLDFLKDLLGEQYAGYEKKISAQLGINGFVNVALLYVHLVIEQEARLRTTDPLMTIPTDHELYPLLKKLELITSLSDKFPEYSVGGIMMQPFIPLSGGLLAFTGTHDLALISERIWANYLFKEGTLKTLVPRIAKSSFPSFFGGYVEKFLLGKVLSALHQTGLRVILSDDQRTPDATIILNETDIFLIEIKSSSLHYKDWEEQNLEKFKSYLNDNFISDKKGVIQLHKCLQHLADEPETLLGLRTKLSKLKIYPVIIYTEPHVTTVAVNDHIIENAPVIPPELTQKFSHIYPVTLIDHDFFLENSQLLRDNKRLLKEAIIRYHKGLAQRKKQWQKFNSTMNFSKAMESFDIFSIGYNGLYRLDQNAIAKEIKAIFNGTT